MAVHTLVRRLHRAHTIIFRPQHLRSLPHQTFRHPSLPYQLPETFYQTLVTTSTIQQRLHFSTLQSSHSKKLYQIINFNEYIEEANEKTRLVVCELVELIQKAKDFDSGDEAMDFLDSCRVKPSEDVIFSAIWALREEWKLAFLVFRWGEKQDIIVEKTWCLMIWILGNHKKFGTAWSLIHDLYQNSVDTRHAILIIIDRYAAENHSGKAVQTFQIMEKFSLSLDQETFFTFLNILCKHGNIEEAEEFMLLNKKFFPLETEGFNIILNGWCNIVVDIFEAKRVWREMSKCCIFPNGTSYAHMISCFSKVGNLFDSLRLYDEMKKRGFPPGIEVYNSLTYILAHENCLKEALIIVDKMKEAGLQPDSITYNSMIRPLCQLAKVKESRMILSLMIEDNVSPTVDTYHAFLGCASLGGTFEVLTDMSKAGLGPSKDTFLQILGKFFELKQPENALKIWQEMKQYEIVPDSAHYNVLVEGLAKCRLLVEAREFYAEMRSKGTVNNPKLDKLLTEPAGESSCQEGGQMRIVKHISKGRSSVIKRKRCKNSSKKRTSGS